MKIECVVATWGEAQALVPFDSDAERHICKWGAGEHVVIDMKRARNPHYHRYAMGMLRRLWQMSEEGDRGFDAWRKMLTIKAGHFIAIGSVDVKGTVRQAVEAESLSFENMDEDEFRAVWKDLHQAFIEKYGDSITYKEVMEWVSM